MSLWDIWEIHTHTHTHTFYEESFCEIHEKYERYGNQR